MVFEHTIYAVMMKGLNDVMRFYVLPGETITLSHFASQETVQLA